MTLLALAIAPGIAICLFIIYKDMYNREPRLNLFVSFILGALAIIPAAFGEIFISGFIGDNLAGVLIYAFLVVALAEEGCKYLVLRYYSYTKKSFDEPFDGIVYGVIVSMGFATIENIAYVIKFGYGAGIIRMFVSVPAHAAFGILMGYYVGKAKFAGTNSFNMLTKGLLAAIFFHGSFDFFLFLKEHTWVKQFVSDGLLFGGAVASYIIAIRLSRKAINEHQQLSREEYERNNHENII